MKYFTKKWYNLMQNLDFTDGIKVIEDKEYSEEEIERICAKEYKKQLEQFVKQEEECYNEPPINYIELMGDDFNYKDVILVDEKNNIVEEPKSKKEAMKLMENLYNRELEEFKNRPKFNRKEIEKEFEEMQKSLQEYYKKAFPDFISEKVDIRFLSLNLMPKTNYNNLKEYEDKNKKEFEEIELLADKELNSQNITEHIQNLFFGLHDAKIIKIEQNNLDCIITIISEEDKKVVLKFENSEFIENELEEYIKKDLEEYGVFWLYNELYKVDNNYELHILVDTEDGLKYITIRCKDIQEG